jgi:hypothetical protein
METEEQKETSPSGLCAAPLADQAHPSSAAPGAECACMADAAAVASASASRGNSAPLRNLWRDLLAGLKISLSLQVNIDRIYPASGVLALLVIADFLFNLLESFLLVGPTGYFASSAVPQFFFHLPLFLLFGFLAGRILSRPSLGIQIPLLLIALSIPIEFIHAVMEGMSQMRELSWLQDYLEARHYYRFFWWWSTASVLFLFRLEPAPRSRRLWTMLLFLVLVVQPLWYFQRADLWTGGSESAESGELHLTDKVLAAQSQLLNGQLAGLLPGRNGETDLYFVGFAGDATQDVFLKELRSVEQLFSTRFGSLGRSVILANNPRTAATLPFATAGNLERALKRVGEVMERDHDILFLYLTSHGSSEHELGISNRPLELSNLTPAQLRNMLKSSGIKYKVVVVSACYAGGFIDPLKDERTMIITAADASHESFGCGYGEDFTWFGEAFIEDGLRQSFSFTAAFDKAREKIRQWEDEQDETPSNPQIWVGKEIEPRLAALQRELEQK